MALNTLLWFSDGWNLSWFNLVMNVIGEKKAVVEHTLLPGACLLYCIHSYVPPHFVTLDME